jgi:hypothetical protein
MTPVCTRPGAGHSQLPKLHRTTFFYILGVAHLVACLNLHKEMPHQPLCSYYYTASKIYHSLASQDIHPNTLCISPTPLHHPCFCVNPASVECHSLHTSSAMALFSCRVNVLLINLVGHWHTDTKIHYIHVQSCPIKSGLSKLIPAGGNPYLLVETATMPLPKPTQSIPICGLMGC